MAEVRGSSPLGSTREIRVGKRKTLSMGKGQKHLATATTPTQLLAGAHGKIAIWPRQQSPSSVTPNGRLLPELSPWQPAVREQFLLGADGIEDVLLVVTCLYARFGFLDLVFNPFLGPRAARRGVDALWKMGHVVSY